MLVCLTFMMRLGDRQLCRSTGSQSTKGWRDYASDAASTGEMVAKPACVVAKLSAGRVHADGPRGTAKGPIAGRSAYEHGKPEASD
jgi:hypothetical protein